jgi:hypothetical protein
MTPFPWDCLYPMFISFEGFTGRYEATIVFMGYGMIFA